MTDLMKLYWHECEVITISFAHTVCDLDVCVEATINPKAGQPYLNLLEALTHPEQSKVQCVPTPFICNHFLCYLMASLSG